MALPKLDVPTYELELPVSKRKIKYRPFLVKEQKNLLMALESGESETIQQNVHDILYNCTVTEGVDIDKLPIVDVEFFFVNLRAKSVGEIIQSRYRCNNSVTKDGEERECGNIMEKDVDLNTVKVDVPDNTNFEIKLSERIIIKMKFPEFGLIRDSIHLDDINDVTFNMIANCIEYIYEVPTETFHYAREAQPGEMLEFVEGMNQEQFEKVEAFFNILPRMKQDLDITCNKCGFEHHLVVEGLEDFFG
jgi:hypothetical protein